MEQLSGESLTLMSQFPFSTMSLKDISSEINCFVRNQRAGQREGDVTHAFPAEQISNNITERTVNLLFGCNSVNCLV